MTSTPTACPDCDGYGNTLEGTGYADEFGNEVTRQAPCHCIQTTPRQPDMSSLERDVKRDEIFTYHACLSGDCPHEKHIECFEAIYDAGHARALKEMGAEVYRLKIALDQKEFTLQNTFNQWQERCEQLAAAQAKLKEFDEYYTFQNLERVEEQLAAAELKAGEYEKALKLAQTMLIEATNTPPPSDARWTIIADALAANRRGGES